MRGLFLSMLLVCNGAIWADEAVAKTHVYKQEFQLVKENPVFENLFDEDVNHISHEFERAIHNSKHMPSIWQRLGCFMFLLYDTIVITPEMMPELYAFVESFAQKSGMPTPKIFISLNEHVFNAFAAKFINSVGGILIEQKLLNELADNQLKAVIAHELGHIKHNHINKNIALLIPSLAASLYVVNKGINCVRNYIGIDRWRYKFLEFDVADYYIRGLGVAALTLLGRGLIIGKRFEKEADQFAFESGYAADCVEAFTIMEDKIKKVDAELAATNDKLMAEKDNLTPADFSSLQQELWKATMWYRFYLWIHRNTPFESHPSNADRIAAAQAYLAAQEAAKA